MIAENMELACKKSPDKIFFVNELNESLSYRDILSKVSSCFAYFESEQTISTTIVLECSNTATFVVCFIAALSYFKTIFLIGRNEYDDFKRCVGVHECFFAAHAEQIKSIAFLPSPSPTYSRPETIRYIGYFNSGTTASKKLLVFDKDVLIRRYKNWAHDLSIEKAESFFCTTTFAHSHGFNLHLLPALISGCCLIAPDLTKMSAHTVLRIVERRKPAFLSLTPQLAAILMRFSVGHESLLRNTTVIIGSDSLSSDLKIEFEQKFCCKVLDQFGSAETGPTFLLDHINGRRYLREFFSGRNIAFQCLHEKLGLYSFSVRSVATFEYLYHNGTRQVASTYITYSDILRKDERGYYLSTRSQALVVKNGTLYDLTELEVKVELRFPIQCVCIKKEALIDSDFIVLYASVEDIHEALTCFVEGLVPSGAISVERIDHLITTNLGKKVRNLGSYCSVRRHARNPATDSTMDAS